MKYLRLPNFKSHYKTTIIKISGLGERIYKPMEQNPKIDPHMYGQLTFNKGDRLVGRKYFSKNDAMGSAE